MSRLLAVPLAAACALLGHAATAAPPLVSPPAITAPAIALADAPSAMESRLMDLTNAERAERGLKPLTWDGTLCEAGRGHSLEMAALNYFDHSSPTRGLETPADRWERVASELPAKYTIGENLFYGSETDVAWAHRSLMKSAGHRENILSPRYTRIGIGIHTAPDGQMWVTEMFRS
jgi:uncharacterized protein YkwD